MTAYTGAAVPGAIPVIAGGTNGLGSGGIGDLLIGALLFGGMGANGLGNRFGYGMGTPVQQAATGAVATDLLLSPAFQNIQAQISNLSETMGANKISSDISQLGASMADMSQNIISSGTNDTRQLASDIGSVATSLATGNFTTLSSINGLNSALTAQNTQNLIQGINQSQFTNGLITNGNNQTNLALLTGFNAVEKSIDIVSREMAECCCAIKGEIHSDGEATRALINNLNVQNLQQQLCDAKQQLATSNQTITQSAIAQQQTATILAHLAKPCNDHGHGGNGNGNGNS